MGSQNANENVSCFWKFAFGKVVEIFLKEESLSRWYIAHGIQVSYSNYSFTHCYQF